MNELPQPISRAALERFAGAAAGDLDRFFRDLLRSIDERDHAQALAVPQLFTAREFGVSIDSPDNQRALQDAIDAAEATTGGGVVLVDPGRFKMGGKLTIQASEVSLLGSGWTTILDFTPAGALSNGIEIGISAPVLQRTTLARMQLVGAPGSSAVIVNGLLQPILSELSLDGWLVGFDNYLVAGITNGLLDSNFFGASISTVSARLLMNFCRFTNNHEEPGAFLGLSELSGSNDNVFAGNTFANVPILLGSRTTCRAHANVGLSTLHTSTSLVTSQNPSIMAELVRYNRTSGNGNQNYDTLAVLGTSGRRIGLVVAVNAGGTGRQVTVRDVGTPTAGNFELDFVLGNQIVLAGETWYFDLILGPTSALWVELSRKRIA